MLSIQNLQIGYKNSLDYPPINTHLQANEFVALIGRNGSGKTTLLRTLTGLLEAKTGTIKIDDTPLQELRSKQLAQYISIVTTEKVNISYLSVKDLVALGRQPYLNFWGQLSPEDHKAIDDTFDLMDIHYLKEKYINQCSDGERQLVMLARALAQNTAIILLDEITAHLDFVNRVKLFKILKQLSKTKLILIATHDIELALKAADSIILMQAPNIHIASPKTLIEQGHIDNAFSAPYIRYNTQQERFDVDF
ncbi:MAG: ABC transporter ATP-binding protein [Aureispira sp.]|nr:ABC transporter ATP-binding protein [Aureispira sp.]